MTLCSVFGNLKITVTVRGARGGCLESWAEKAETAVLGRFAVRAQRVLRPQGSLSQPVGASRAGSEGSNVMDRAPAADGKAWRMTTEMPKQTRRGHATEDALFIF